MPESEPESVPYTAAPRPRRESSEELRARIPGWGADLDPADRPAYPRERYDPGATGAHWELPEQQEPHATRERSVEHARVTPVFGSTMPLRGLSGAVRRYAYTRHSEAKAMHWLLLLAADRVDVVESTVGAALRGRPDNPLAETGIRAEVPGRGLASRLGRGRADVVHHAVDPFVNAAPWVAGAAGAAWVVRHLTNRG